jgi:hypothetical protein
MADLTDTFDYARIQLADPIQWTPFHATEFIFHHVEIDPVPNVSAAPESSVPAAVDEPNSPTTDDTQPTDPTNSDDDTGTDPYTLTGTDSADRFTFESGYDSAYTVLNFQHGVDKLVIDATAAGFDHVEFQHAVTTEDGDTILQGNATYEDGNLSVVMDNGPGFLVNFASDGDTPELTPGDFIIL